MKILTTAAVLSGLALPVMAQQPPPPSQLPTAQNAATAAKGVADQLYNAWIGSQAQLEAAKEQNSQLMARVSELEKEMKDAANVKPTSPRTSTVPVEPAK